MTKLLLAPATAAIAIIAVAGFAGASSGSKTAPDSAEGACEVSAGEQVFLDWQDRKRYVPAPDGSFEGAGSGWTFERGAEVVEGGAPVEPERPGAALSMPAGSSATSPAFCLVQRVPTARMFAVATTAGGEKARLRVEVLTVHRHGELSKSTGAVKAGEQWSPTRKLSLAQGLARKSDQGLVRLRFEAEPGSALTLDGLYIDP